MTYNHELDRRILLRAVQKPFKYTGMIGSRRKAEVTHKFLLNNGIPPEVIDKIDMPIGMDINAETPGEIAISILARLIQVKNQKGTKEKEIMNHADIPSEECKGGATEGINYFSCESGGDGGKLSSSPFIGSSSHYTTPEDM